MSLLVAALFLAPQSNTAESYLYQPAFCIDHTLRGPARPYHPQPGDIFLATDHLFWAKISHRFGITGAPQHSGIVVTKRDGQLALLEAGPFNTLHVRVHDLIPALTKYAETDRVWIRPRRVPLTAEQNCRLTAFAEAVDGRRFAVARLLWQGTPFRPRSPLKIHHLAKPRAVDFVPGCEDEGLKRSYFCSELVTEALVAARLIDSHTARPAATYPRDLFFGRSINRYIDEHLHLCEWEAPARWTRCPGCESCIKPRPWLDLDGPGPRRR
jgi:hypothetical protein